jgi:hypothetical protein
MIANGWRRAFTVLLVAWTALTVGGPVPVHVCPEPGAAEPAAPMAMHHAGHHAGAHHSPPGQHGERHGSICLGCCQAAGTAHLPAPPSIVHAPTLAAAAPAPAGRRAPAPAPPAFLRPPSNGPPALRA